MVVALARTLLAETPTGANEVSRWLTVRALVDNGTYVIGAVDREHCTVGPLVDWQMFTIDKILNVETRELVSDKPPILPTVMAAEYWLLARCGLGFADHGLLVVRTLLVTFNLLPLLGYLLGLAFLVEWLGRSHWGRVAAVAAGCFGTFVPPFSAVINNHVHGAFAALAAAAALLVIWSRRSRHGGWFAVAGFAGGWAVCNELPALGFLVVVSSLLALADPKRTMMIALPAAAVPLAAYFVTNTLALGQWLPWYSGLPGKTVWRLRFAGSYWTHPIGTDIPEPSRFVYAFHTILGHHGFLSLTPIFVLGFWQMTRVLGLARQRVVVIGVLACLGVTVLARQLGAPWMAAMLPALASSLILLVFPVRWWREASAFEVLNRLVASTSISVVAFWLCDKANYGGAAAGPRHFLWLTPLWLLAMLSILDELAHARWKRRVYYAALALSVFSAATAVDAPLTSDPWLYRWTHAVPRAAP